MSEESVLVVDVGSSSLKAGFSGEDIPSFVFPSTVSIPTNRNIESIEGWSADTAGVPIQYANIISSHPVHRGAVKDWDLMEKLWHNLIDHTSLSNLESTSVLIIESVRSTLSDRSHWAELLFNTFHVPSICFGNTASLSVFASGRTTGVAVECGSGLTATVPVFEGLVLKHATITMDYAGQDISINLRRLFNEKNIQVDLNSAKIIKERLAYTQGYRNKDLEQTMKENMTFSLPDGNDVTVDTKVFRDCTDTLFINPKSATGGLINQLHESIILCDDALKRELSHNIITSGGTTMIPGFGDRLQNDMMNKFQNEFDSKLNALYPMIRVVPTSNYREPGYTQQRKFAPWIGGSLLGSFETYHKSLKITKQEWEENADIVLNVKSV